MWWTGEWHVRLSNANKWINNTHKIDYVVQTSLRIPRGHIMLYVYVYWFFLRLYIYKLHRVYIRLIIFLQVIWYLNQTQTCNVHSTSVKSWQYYIRSCFFWDHRKKGFAQFILSNSITPKLVYEINYFSYTRKSKE